MDSNLDDGHIPIMVSEKEALKKELAVATATESTSSDDKHYDGIVFSITDGSDPKPPVEKRLTTSTAPEWFKAYPEDVESPILKVLAHKISPEATQAGFDIPFSKNIVDEAIWSSRVYTDWSRLQTGACAALTEHPHRFVLQTPNDGFPFVSLAMTLKGHICKGIYTYDHPEFDPILLMPGERLYSGWRNDGIQIVSIPQAILKVHSAWLASEISRTLKRLREVEEALASPYVRDFFALQRTLHSCADAVLDLERRSEFESLIIAAIEVIATKSRFAEKGQWPTLAPAKAAIQLRRVELTVIPKRIESARTAINDNIIQQTRLQSLQIAESTQKIAEATMNDSASMRTIAILTMLFLPGTAVASFFSMTMWNWSPGEGESLVSSWLWIYFAVAVPLTAMTIGVWYFWLKVRTRQLQTYLPTIMSQPAPAYSKQSVDGKTD